MSLKEPNLKMSKSHSDERSRILLTDSSEEIHKKIRLALTDSTPRISYDPIRRPGVSNLIEILRHIDETDGKTCEELALQYESTSMRSFKEHVASKVAHHLKEIREKYFTLVQGNAGYLDAVADLGARTARANADLTIKSVKAAVGL